MDLRFNVIPLDLNPSHYDAQGSYIFRKRRFSSLMHLPCVHAAATTPVQQLGVFLAHLTPPYQPSPIPLSGRPAHRPFRGLLGVYSRCGLHTRAVTVYRDRYPRASDISSPPCLPRLLPAGAVAGWALHPLESAALSRRTWKPVLRRDASGRRGCTDSSPSRISRRKQG